MNIQIAQQFFIGFEIYNQESGVFIDESEEDLSDEAQMTYGTANGKPESEFIQLVFYVLIIIGAFVTLQLFVLIIMIVLSTFVLYMSS